MITKALFKAGEYIRCFELLQKNYTENPSFSFLLMLYGKYVIKTMYMEKKQRLLAVRSGIGRETMANTTGVDSGYLGSGIGALEECQRVCLAERQALISYMIGRAYQLLEMQFKTYEYWKQA